MGTRIIHVTRDYWITSDLHRSINRDYKIKRRVIHFLIESTFLRVPRYNAREKIWKISLPLPKLIRQVWRIDTHDVKTKRNHESRVSQFTASILPVTYSWRTLLFIRGVIYRPREVSILFAQTPCTRGLFRVALVCANDARDQWSRLLRCQRLWQRVAPSKGRLVTRVH